MLVAGIKLGDHLPFQQVVERLGFSSVPGRIVVMFLAITQRPPHFRRVGFRPPAVQFRQIDAAIDEHLHPACPTRLPGPPWRVDPDVHPLHQMLGQKHVVVTEKDRMAARFGPPDEMRPFLNHGLPRLVSRMGFAGNDELHRAPSIRQ